MPVMYHAVISQETLRPVLTELAVTGAPHMADYGPSEYGDIAWEKAVTALALPTHLWHYTDSAGFLGITRSRSLWCTEYRHLNDSAEVATFAAALQNYMRGELRARLSKEEGDQIIDLSNIYVSYNVFVSSFCAVADRNEHWSQYAKKAGFAIGFDPEGLRSIAKTQGFALGPVIYGEQQALGIATALAKDNEAWWNIKIKSPLERDVRDNILRLIVNAILMFGPFFKRAEFAGEQEWRLVKFTGVKGDGNVEFRAAARPQPWCLLGG